MSPFTFSAAYNFTYAKNIITSGEPSSSNPPVIDLISEEEQEEIPRCRLEINEITCLGIFSQLRVQCKMEQPEIVDFIDLTDDKKDTDLSYLEILVGKAYQQLPILNLEQNILETFSLYEDDNNTHSTRIDLNSGISDQNETDENKIVNPNCKKMNGNNAYVKEIENTSETQETMELAQNKLNNFEMDTELSHPPVNDIICLSSKDLCKQTKSLNSTSRSVSFTKRVEVEHSQNCVKESGNERSEKILKNDKSSEKIIVDTENTFQEEQLKVRAQEINVNINNSENKNEADNNTTTCEEFCIQKSYHLENNSSLYMDNFLCDVLQCENNELNESSILTSKQYIRNRNSPDLFLFRDREDDDLNYSVKLNESNNDNFGDTSQDEDNSEIKNITKKAQILPLKTYERKRKVKCNINTNVISSHIKDNSELNSPIFSSFSPEIDPHLSAPINVLSESLNHGGNIPETDIIVPLLETSLKNKDIVASENNIIFSATASKRLGKRKWKDLLETRSHISIKPNVVFSTDKPIDIYQKEKINMNTKSLEEKHETELTTSRNENVELRSLPTNCFSESDAHEICKLIGKGFIKNTKARTLNAQLKKSNKHSDSGNEYINHNQNIDRIEKDVYQVNMIEKIPQNISGTAIQKRKSVSFADLTQECSSSVINIISSLTDPIILDRKSYEGSSSHSSDQSWNSSMNKTLTQSIHQSLSTTNQHKIINNQHCSVLQQLGSDNSFDASYESSTSHVDSGMVKNILNLESEDSNQLSVFNQIDDTSANISSNKIFIDGTSCEKDNNLSDQIRTKCQVQKDFVSVEYLPHLNTNENSTNVDDSFLPEITGDDFSEEELIKYFSPAGSADTFETSTYKDIPAELLPLLYHDRLVKKFEGQVVLPLKKRRKLSQFSDNASIKDEEIHCFESQKIGSDINKDVFLTGMKNESNLSAEGISYPSTPMLSIANFENMICVPQKQSNKRFKTPGQLKEITPIISCASVPSVVSVAPVASVTPVSSISTAASSVNPVGAMNFNILPSSTPHNIVNNGRNYSEIRNSVQTFNLLQPQQTVVNSTGGIGGNVQTFNIISSRAGVSSRNSGNLYNENIQQRQQPDINSMNVNFNIGNANDLSTLQTFNVHPSSLQYAQSFHPNSQYTYSIQSNSPQNQISLQSLCDIQSIINLSNYQMNPQHLSNFLHNSQINLQAKQAVLLNDLNIPCNLQINTTRPRSYEQDSYQSNACKSNICDSYNICKNHTKKCCGEFKTDSSSVNISLSTANCSSRGRSKKNLNHATDRITRSSNRTSIVNYKDDDMRPVGFIPRKRKNTSDSRKWTGISKTRSKNSLSRLMFYNNCNISNSLKNKISKDNSSLKNNLYNLTNEKNKKSSKISKTESISKVGNLVINSSRPVSDFDRYLREKNIKPKIKVGLKNNENVKHKNNTLRKLHEQQLKKIHKSNQELLLSYDDEKLLNGPKVILNDICSQVQFSNVDKCENMRNSQNNGQDHQHCSQVNKNRVSEKEGRYAIVRLKRLKSQLFKTKLNEPIIVNEVNINKRYNISFDNKYVFDTDTVVSSSISPTSTIQICERNKEIECLQEISNNFINVNSIESVPSNTQYSQGNGMFIIKHENEVSSTQGPAGEVADTDIISISNAELVQNNKVDSSNPSIIHHTVHQGKPRGLNLNNFNLNIDAEETTDIPSTTKIGIQISSKKRGRPRKYKKLYTTSRRNTKVIFRSYKKRRRQFSKNHLINIKHIKVLPAIINKSLNETDISNICNNFVIKAEGARTYSNFSYNKKIFVPPEVEQIFEDSVPAHGSSQKHKIQID